MVPSYAYILKKQILVRFYETKSVAGHGDEIIPPWKEQASLAD
jgi:hypothetical protein